MYKLLIGLLFSACFIFVPEIGFSQITSGANDLIPTDYSSGPQDMIHIFCGNKDELKASLTANYPEGESGTFEWFKYNPVIGDFDIYPGDLANGISSTISNLENGCYRVKLSTTSGDKIYTAWVFNNYIEATADIPQSDCDYFTLEGAFDSPVLEYVDLTNGQTKQLTKDIQARWMLGSSKVSSVLTSKVYSPPTKDTQYTLEVTDRFGCVGKADVIYHSIVTKASFEYTMDEHKSDTKKNEAPLTVTFTNNSENGDPGKYEWFIYKDLQKIIEEKEAGTFKDSIDQIIYSDSPVYIFEETGSYKVKLVSKKVSEFNTCTDTMYMADYIIVDESLIDAPNAFTPNGDGTNDIFAVRFFSMKSVKVSIFNRWGKRVHMWESNNVRGFYNSASTIPESVWDGKIGGHLASPGVYYWVAEGIGRDGKKQSENGFVHLFRDK
ncbi:MAG: gliding motility-associated C-terminal domain-containing protein [Prolixibacteraceae bacterium]